jgi:hypothetical protein
MNKSLQKIERLTDPLELADKNTTLRLCFANVVKQLGVFGRHTSEMLRAVASESMKFMIGQILPFMIPAYFSSAFSSA